MVIIVLLMKGYYKTVDDCNKFSDVERGLKTMELYFSIYDILVLYQLSKNMVSNKIELLEQWLKLKRPKQIEMYAEKSDY